MFNFRRPAAASAALYSLPKDAAKAHDMRLRSSSKVVMTTFRAVRLALDYFASVEGRKEARNLCAIYGAASVPSDALKAASVAFRDTARGALGEARIGGSQEALLAYLLELWHMSLMVEIKRQRGKMDQG